MPAIRPATEADCSVAAALLRRSITELCEADHRNDPQLLRRWLANKTEAQLRAWIRDPAYAGFVAVRNDAIQGIGLIRNDGDVLLNYVDPPARFTGVSTALMTVMEDWARDRGLPSCCLQTTQAAIRFYRARGYVPDGPDLLRKRL